MRQFFKFMFASMLGVFLSLILLFFILTGIIAVIVSTMGADKGQKIEENTILEITLDHPIVERSSKNPFENFDLNTMKGRNPIGLNDILKNIKKAGRDEKIKGIWLHINTLQSGFASLEEIRDALIDFKKSGKFMIAYAENYSQGAYYLSSVADQMYLNPLGEVDFKGLKAELVFFKHALEKLEIEPEVIRHGKFKSAIEPFIADKMSEENKAQIADLLDDLWDHVLQNISVERKIDKITLQQIANDLASREASDAHRLKLVDGIKYEDEVVSELKKKAGLMESDKIRTVSLSKYSHAPEIKEEKGFAMEKIAVIYASGNIESGSGNHDNIGSETFAATISKARKDEKVKAIVLRVNSPGGSALASEVIWREIVLAKKTKPVVVSMGDVAASGGYYISCAADSILAEETTITGSIGVFGLLFNAQKLLENKLGITTDTYKTAQYADIGTITRPLTAAEKEILQGSVEKIYDVFTKRVADGRKMSQAEVDSIGQGRIWSGKDALRIGLIDRIGGVEDAIIVAARMAKITKYRISSLPEQKEPFMELIENIKNEAETAFVKRELGYSYAYYKNLQALQKFKGILTWMPFELHAE